MPFDAAAAMAECIAWRDGARFPLDDELYEQVGVAVRSEFHGWWRVLRELSISAESEEELRNLSYVLAAALAEHREVDALARDEAIGDRRLMALVAEAVRYVWMTGEPGAAARRVRDLFGTDRIVDTFMQYQRTNDPIDFWSWEVVSGLVEEAKEDGWKILLAIVDRSADDDELLGLVGAGPLETFVATHGTEYLERIEQAALESPPLRTALSKMWIWDYLPLLTFERIARAAGASLDRPANLDEASERRAARRRFDELASRVSDRLEVGDAEGLLDAVHELNRYLGLDAPE